MLFKAGIILLFLTTEVRSDCQCFQTPKVTGLSASVNNAFDTSTFNACYSAACGFEAYSGNDTVGWNSISITWQTVTDTTAALTVYDGTSDSAATLATLTPSNSSATFTSSSASIYIKYTQTVTTSGNIYFGTAKAGGALAVPTSPATTTVAPTTRSYNDPTFVKDPHLISHDILIVVNPKNPNGLAGLSALNLLVGEFVDQLAITYSSTSASQSRLALATITPYFPYAAIQGTIWGLNSTLLKSSLPTAGISYDGNIDSALSTLVGNAFNVADVISPTRANVQRTVLLFTADWPSSNATLGDDVKNKFLSQGANLGVISYNLTDTTALNSVSRWYNFVNLATTNATSVAQFVNPFFFNDKSAANYWCPLGSVTNSTTGIFYFSEPSNYKGPCSGGGGAACTTAWTTTFDGQTGTYCNYQDSTYSYTNTGTTLTVTVFYELEIERDYLRFYADDVEIESFTGVDVYSATFVTTAKTLRARFQTDNQAVYRGFYVQIQQS